ncbi:translation elongation factor Ts protein [Medicago truncatula]|uniref:Translation elongation factor Ts protein n=1 Tax=Medicago truncatula TaxID=3880 RepID=A0A072UCH4_MEDTR|nr:translation elongation factor Ts protein [Medicago truncatula]
MHQLNVTTCADVSCTQAKLRIKWTSLMQILNCSMLGCRKSTVLVSAFLVKQLREETGAGMMDCKKARAETEGDLEKPQAYLIKKGLSSADKKSGRLAEEGRIVNGETDFVGRSEKFKELVDDLAMQVAFWSTGSVCYEGNLSLLEKPFIKDDSVSVKNLVRRTTILPAFVRQLRDETGAGMMECKNPLSESEG